MFDPPKLPKIKGSMHPRFEEILTPEALAFVASWTAPTRVAGPSCWPRAANAASASPRVNRSTS